MRNIVPGVLFGVSCFLVLIAIWPMVTRTIAYFFRHSIVREAETIVKDAAS